MSEQVRVVLTLADCDMSGKAKPPADKTCFSQPLPRGEVFEQVSPANMLRGRFAGIAATDRRMLWAEHLTEHVRSKVSRDTSQKGGAMDAVVWDTAADQSVAR